MSAAGCCPGQHGRPELVQLRATRADGTPQRHGDWTSAAVTVRRGATLAARVAVAAGVTVGAHAFVVLGSVVVRDVPAHALVGGNPARQAGWVCLCAATLDDTRTCPQSGCGRRYVLTGDRLHLVDVATRA